AAKRGLGAGGVASDHPIPAGRDPLRKRPWKIFSRIERKLLPARDARRRRARRESDEDEKPKRKSGGRDSARQGRASWVRGHTTFDIQPRLLGSRRQVLRTDGRDRVFVDHLLAPVDLEDQREFVEAAEAAHTLFSRRQANGDRHVVFSQVVEEGVL